MTQSNAWVTCDVWDEPHWEGECCENPILVKSLLPRVWDTVLKCFINDPPHAKPGQGERYH